MKKIIAFLGILSCFFGFSQEDTSYKKRVLESAEIDLLFSYYNQDGDNAAVTGGEGTEELTDAASSIVLKIPINEDDVLTVDTGISSYTSASSSNVNPFDGDINNASSPFSASSGASKQDALVHFSPSYSHSSDDRNKIWNAKAYVSSEYDYFSLGFGGGYTYLFNEKNTTLSIDGQVYLDSWRPQYPIELRSGFFDSRITGTGDYTPIFEPFSDKKRNSYSVSLGLAQILGKRAQASVFVDFVSQNGLLSSPMQRVYFADRDNFFIEEFQLADALEKLPDSRFKIPFGARFNYYVNDYVILRSYYRFYTDDWGITSHTANIEVPVKISETFTLYPTYRFYTQTAADYFYEKEQAVSTLPFYTSDYDLSNYDANQYGMGVRYKDILTRAKVLRFGLKTVDFRFSKYDRSDGLNAYIFTLGVSFVKD